MTGTIYSHPAIARNRFYKEPATARTKELGPCMPMYNGNGLSPDELEIERTQRCTEMEDERELPF